MGGQGGNGGAHTTAMAALAVVTLTSFGLAGFMFYTYRSQQRQLQELLRSKDEDSQPRASGGRRAGKSHRRDSHRPERRKERNSYGNHSVNGTIQEESEAEIADAMDAFSRPDDNLLERSRLQREEFIADKASSMVTTRMQPSEDERGMFTPPTVSGAAHRPREASAEEGPMSAGSGPQAVTGGREGVFKVPMSSVVTGGRPSRSPMSEGAPGSSGLPGSGSGPMAMANGSMPMRSKAMAIPVPPATSSTKHLPASFKAQRAVQLLEEAQQVSVSPRTLMESEYARLIAPELDLTDEQQEVSAMLVEALQMRDRYLFKPAVPLHERPEMSRDCATLKEAIGEDPFEWRPEQAMPWTYEFVDGVMVVYDGPDKASRLFAPPADPREFFTDFQALLKMTSSGPVKTFCHHRLLLLEQKFNLHLMLNAEKEFQAQRVAPHRDFYNVRKVDTHIHHSAGMHQKHLLRFIKSKLKKEPDEVVIFRDGKYLTLKEVFESLKLSAYDLNIDLMDMHADKSTFHRFDKFNSKYNPCGQSRLREIFIKQDNLLHGRYLAELTKEMIQDLEASKYQHAEYRISIYGRQQREWDTLAAWVVQNKLYSNNVVWMIQIPRLYNVYKDQGLLANFQEMLDNIFVPLFEVTVDPNSHPHLHMFLRIVVGFDMVDDESRPERRPSPSVRMPAEWDGMHNPPHAYYAYFIYANLYTLNKMREARGLNTFAFRPHCGEAGDVDHLVAGFMLCQNIAHGINLRKSSSLQYLYFLGQIGLCMSPLSNNSLFLDYHRNPFPTFFARGLQVSLSSDDPVQIHLTKEPLVEEYSVAAQVWKLSAADLCEIARNSVLQSGFPHECKMHWVGQEYWKSGPSGNDIQKTNVPDVRLRFRQDVYVEEMTVVVGGAHAYAQRQRAKLEKMDREAREQEGK